MAAPVRGGHSFITIEKVKRGKCMMYFIPAWYRENTWCENEQAWQYRKTGAECDDMVKQIQLCQQRGEDSYGMLLLSYAPNLRHFMHRQNLYCAPRWCCFDAIQEISRKRAVPFFMHDLPWPEGIEWIHTPFVVLAMLHGKRYAMVEFGEDGNMIWMEQYQDDQISRKNIYDDRGFVSSVIRYQKGKPWYQEFLMENGDWKMRVFPEDGHVEINPECPRYMISIGGCNQFYHFSKLRYDKLEEVLKEVFCSCIQHTKPEDVFCIARHERHAQFLEDIAADRKVKWMPDFG